MVTVRTIANEQFYVLVAHTRVELQWVHLVALTALFCLFDEKAIAVGERNKEIKVALQAYYPVSFFTIWMGTRATRFLVWVFARPPHPMCLHCGGNINMPSLAGDVWRIGSTQTAGRKSIKYFLAKEFEKCKHRRLAGRQKINMFICTALQHPQLAGFTGSEET